MSNNELAELLIRVPVVLLALTVHEFCHAYFALRMGDPTAYRLGRCTLNPIKHLDPLGTICLMFAPIGWAKPVPINSLNFHNQRKGILVSTAAGPFSNLVMAVGFALILRGILTWGGALNGTPQGERLLEALNEMAWWGVFINVGLAVFNLLPIYPLDGFHISAQFMRGQSQRRFLEMAPMGPFLILGLVMVGYVSDFRPLFYLLQPPMSFLLRHVAGVAW